MTDIAILDNYLDEGCFKHIQDLVSSSNFPWYRSLIVSPSKFSGEKESNLQFTHTFYRDFCPHSNLFPELKNLFHKINPTSLVRVKANLTTPSNSGIPHGFHKDLVFSQSDELRVGIFYLTDSDGGTTFNTGETVECKANRYIEFSNLLEHSGVSHTYPHDRIVINVNFYR